MTWVYVALAVLLFLGALRDRARLARFAVLAPSDEPVSPEHRLLVAPGVTVDDATARAASAHARAHGLEALDLLPRDWGTERFLELARFLDPSRYRAQRFVPGFTASHALLVRADLLARAAPELQAPQNPLDFVRLARRLKLYAPTTTDLAVAPGLRAVADDPGWRKAVLEEVLGRFASAAHVLAPLILAILGLGAAFAPPGGWVALAAFHAAPLLAVPLGRLRPRDLLWFVPLRSLVELWSWWRTLVAPRRRAAEDPVAARRPAYDALLAQGLARFFEPRRESCPLCAKTALRRRIRARDLIQSKPGVFMLDECRGCGHIFQNPRLSLEGLDFYYRDFYEGLGGEAVSLLFGAQEELYLARARMVAGIAEPRRWLDVGGGHGHFGAVAREVWPETAFDALDFGENVLEAERRGWVGRGLRGLFPDLAPALAGAYDVVSMSHYLEHTRDPRAELAAAATALGPGGLLLVEVPDPSSRLGRLLGRFWLPWFQPQHQHFVSPANLARLLDEHGFEPLVWHRGEAHIPVDFFFAVHLALTALAPRANVPWRPPASALGLARSGLVWTIGVPFLLLAMLFDRVCRPFFRRPGLSSAYRVLSRKRYAVSLVDRRAPG